MATSDRLRRLFRHAVSLTTIGAAAASAGCGARIDRTGFDDSACGRTPEPFGGLRPEEPVDSLEFRRGSWSGEPHHAINTIVSYGTPCGGASDPARCERALAAMPTSSGWRKGPDAREYAVYTRGDEVGVVADAAGLKRFLAPIDTMAEASLLLEASDFWLRCEPNARIVEGGREIIAYTGSDCGRNERLEEHRVFVSNEGNVEVRETALVEKGSPFCTAGRRPQGFRPSETPGDRTAIARYCEVMAELEAASVYAFERLGRELQVHGAPPSLVLAASRAAWDEVRHAERMAELARRFGGTPRFPEAETLDVRPLLEIAIENAVEGCVRETFGALLATYQAEHAKDDAIARAHAEIAADETAHAALAWDVRAFLDARLSDEERAQVRAAELDAIAALVRGVAGEVDPDVAEAMGLPDAQASETLLAWARSTLWSGALAA
jgi:hypothetical protein